DSKQIFSREELINEFSLEGINKANSIFDAKKDDPKFFTDPKAISLNAHYLRTMPVNELVPYIKAEFEKAGIWNRAFEEEKRDWFLQTVNLIRVRFNFTTDFVTLGRTYFSDEYPMDPGALEKNILKHDSLREWFPMLADRLNRLEDFSLERTEGVIRKLAEEKDIKPGILINGIRTAVTGQAVGPGLFEVLEAVGKERVVARLRKAIELFN
ncbi:MAG: glutamate--tRNA ligase, partial [Deltaproteobacteria bacterium]|nr:glutamate--tRNA ligase [Deltaproteobacteria bacterium]